MEKTYAIIEDGAVANMALADAPLDDNWILAPAGVAIGWLYEGKVFSAPPAPEPLPEPVPAEVPRWAGLLSIKRHALAGGELVLLPAEHPGDTSLHAAVQALRASMPPGEARDRLDVALNDVKDWTRYSPTVVSMCQALTLRDDQADALFVWAKAQEATI